VPNNVQAKFQTGKNCTLTETT